jgi:hypothetical protein
MLWKFEGKCLYSYTWGDTVNLRNREVGTRDKRGMTVFVLKVNFFNLLDYVSYYMKQIQLNVLKLGYNLLLSTSFPVGHYRDYCVWHCLI